LNSLESPLGLQWNSDNYSCSYDALFGILYNIWVLDSEKWSQEFAFINSEYLDALAKGFKKVIKGKASIEDIRDSIRLELYEICPEDFLIGTSYASVEDLAFKILSSDQVISELQLACSECNYAEVEVDGNLGYILHGQSHGTPTSTFVKGNSL
jgi:hypothetical protein